MSDKESNVISQLVLELLESGAIVESKEESDQFVSRMFTVPKPDGSRRPILNLKYLNEFVQAEHFKMEDTSQALSLMTQNCYMAVIDQREAYHAIPIHVDFQKYLKFRWNGKLYKYTCVPFGLSVAPRLYTKIMKPVVKWLRNQGHICVI